MKLGAVLLLVAITLMIAMPFSVNIIQSGAATVLAALDVCDTSDTNMSMDDSPAVQESAYSLVPADLAGRIQTDDCPSGPFVTIHKEERPPRAIS